MWTRVNLRSGGKRSGGIARLHAAPSWITAAQDRYVRASSCGRRRCRAASGTAASGTRRSVAGRGGGCRGRPPIRWCRLFGRVPIRMPLSSSALAISAPPSGAPQYLRLAGVRHQWHVPHEYGRCNIRHHRRRCTCRTCSVDKGSPDGSIDPQGSAVPTFSAAVGTADDVLCSPPRFGRLCPLHDTARLGRQLTTFMESLV